jgi:hypothetical protein
MNPNGFNPQWPFIRQEPELGALYDWIDSRMQHGHQGRDWGIWGGVTGTLFGLAGGSIGVLLGAMQVSPEQNPMALVGPLLVAGVGSALTGFIIHRRQTPGQRAARRAMAEARNFTWQLVSARMQGNLKGILGEDRAFALNAGAKAYLRSKHALATAAWQAVGPDSDYASTRERTSIAMDVAMARLVTMVGQGAAGDAPEVRRLIADLTEAADEATRTAQHLATDAGHPGDASENLRQVLSEMRLLNSAHDEYDRIRDRSR